MGILRAGVLSALLFSVGIATLPAAADVSQSPFLSLEQVQVGMEGVGKTTVRGDEVRLFQTRVVGVVDNPGRLNDYILVRSSGEVIREAGGYAQGMSGSPIYLDERLAGAFFAAFLYDESPNPIGLVRPIETMLELIKPIQEAAEEAELEDRAQLLPSSRELKRALEGVRLEDGQPLEVVFAHEPPSLEERRAHPNKLYAVRTGTPLWVSGLAGRALEWLRGGVDRELLRANAGSLEFPLSERLLDQLAAGLAEHAASEVYPLTSEPAGEDAFTAPFQPGRPMAALISQGDVTVGGVCTITYVDPQEETLLACGHQLFLTGATNLFLTKARIIDTVSSAPISFVLPEVSRTEVFGAILQDRFQAIGGTLRERARPIQLRAHFRDATTGATRELQVDLAEVDNFLPTLVFAALLHGVDTTLNRIGQGTMRVDYAILGDQMPERLERSDVFTHPGDIAVLGPLQMAQVVSLLQQNEFADPRIERIEVAVETTHPIRQLRVRSIEVDQEVYRPGETVRYAIHMQTFRGPERTVTGSLRLPDEFDTKRITLHAFGGPRRKQGDDGSQTPQFDDLSQLIEAVERGATNDQLTVELLGLPPPTPTGEEGQEREEDAGADFREVKRLGDWVVTGEARTTIQIEPPEPEQEEGPEEPGEECPQLFYC